MAKIIDNPTIKDLMKNIEGCESVESLLRAIPFATKLFPEISEKFAELKRGAELLLVPDRFNAAFGDLGWIAYESMRTDAMTGALAMLANHGSAEAELFLSEYYDDSVVAAGLQRFKLLPELMIRWRLLQLARTDYQERRFHACIPLLLALCDGIVNDASKRVGFFAEGADVSAWDSVAGHETGLGALAHLMRIGRNKTTESEITVPYRNGILHGRDLGFDNRTVAAKCWGALFAIADWALALANPKNIDSSGENRSWEEIFRHVTETQKTKALLDSWAPRTTADMPYLPSGGPSVSFPENTPERAVAMFLENWRDGRYGPMASGLMQLVASTPGKLAGSAKRDFGRFALRAFRITDVVDSAAAMSSVTVEVEIGDGRQLHLLDVRATYLDAKNNPVVRPMTGGDWKIAQASFASVIYPDPGGVD